ncbi:MAG TPA: hypothetical protein VJL90_12340 [Pseudorhodoplanes sp.]|nr:hypothetical protein [Pseudorhodoplanes sp.]
MREGLALTAIGSGALLTLAVAGATTLRHANDLSSKERQALDNSINRIVVEQVARRDDVLPSAATATKGTPSEASGTAAQTTGTVSRDITQLPPGPEARKEAARQNRDPEERAEREARAANAMRRVKKRHPPPAAAFRPDRVLPNAFLTIRKLTFGVL